MWPVAVTSPMRGVVGPFLGLTTARKPDVAVRADRDRSGAADVGKVVMTPWGVIRPMAYAALILVRIVEALGKPEVAVMSLHDARDSGVGPKRVDRDRAAGRDPADRADLVAVCVRVRIE